MKIVQRAGELSHRTLDLLHFLVCLSPTVANTFHVSVNIACGKDVCLQID